MIVMKNRTIVKTLLRFAGFVAGVCLILGTQTAAQGVPPGGPPAPPQSSSPGEEVTSLPSLAGEQGGGFRLAGSPLDILASIRSIAGTGHIEVIFVGTGQVEVVFHGSFELELEHQPFLSGQVALGFQVRSAEQGGYASFGFFGGHTTSFPLHELHAGMALPVELFAGDSSFEGHGFQIGALHPAYGFVAGTCEFGADSLRIVQVGGRF